MKSIVRPKTICCAPTIDFVQITNLLARQKYAELVEQTNAILLPHGEQAKEIIAEAEDSDEEPDAVVNSAVQPLAQKQSSGWSKHVGHAASAKYGNLDAAKPVLPTHQKQQETPEMNVARPVEKVVKSPKKDAKIETFDSMPPMPPMPSLPASIPMSGNSNGLQQVIHGIILMKFLIILIRAENPI